MVLKSKGVAIVAIVVIGGTISAVARMQPETARIVMGGIVPIAGFAMFAAVACAIVWGTVRLRRGRDD